MNNKTTGDIGEAKIISDLVSKGYYVFIGFGDNCRTDIVAMDESYRPIKIQIKTTHEKNDVICLCAYNSGPNQYLKHYDPKQVDVFAVVVLNVNKILYISRKEVGDRGMVTFRNKLPKNNQKVGVHMVSDYLSFERALRDCTGCIQTDNAVDEGTVQIST